MDGMRGMWGSEPEMRRGRRKEEEKKG